MATLTREVIKYGGVTIGSLLSVLSLASLVCCAYPQSQTARPQLVDGLWLSDGYGELLEIDGSNMRAFEVTSVSCIPSWQATRTSGPASEAGITFAQDGSTLRLTPGASADAARMHADWSVSDVLLRRVDQRPKVCRDKLENTPQANYAVFWQTFAENYPFFDLRHLDWTVVDKKFRPQVTSATSPEESFRILRQMIEPLHDAHTFLAATAPNSTRWDLKQRYLGYRPDPNKLDDNDWKKVAEIIESKYVRGGLRSLCKDKVKFGMLEGSIGYLRITGFENYGGNGFAKESQALEDALDVIFRDSEKLKGLVIDVRLNTGGYDGLGVNIASRLTRQKYLAYSKVTRDNVSGPLHFTPPQPVWVTVSTRPGFQGNVVSLIGRDCVSAGETFTMALLGRKPGVMRIGENTQGVYSDVLSRRLPNGWRFGLPNEVYLTEDGKAFDGSGVSPDIAVPVFSREDLRDGRDSALEKALQVLSGRAQP